MEKDLKGTEPTEDESSDSEGTEPTGGVNLRGILVAILGIAATAIFILAGVSMLQIHSQGSLTGNLSIAEVYYHAVGFGFIGFGVLAILLTVKSLWNES